MTIVEPDTDRIRFIPLPVFARHHQLATWMGLLSDMIVDPNKTWQCSGTDMTPPNAIMQLRPVQGIRSALIYSVEAPGRA